MKTPLDRTVTVRFIIFVVRIKNKMNRGEFMGRLLLLMAVVGLKTLLCKGFSLAIFLLLFWLKGKKLGFNSDKWDDFFLQMSSQAVQRYVIVIYLTAAVISSAISYFILEVACYQYSQAIAILLFVGGLALTAYKWHTKGKDYVVRRYQEIPDSIRRKRKENEYE